MDLVQFLSNADMWAALVIRWGGYALLLFLIIVVALVALNATGQARVNHRRW